MTKNLPLDYFSAATKSIFRYEHLPSYSVDEESESTKMFKQGIAKDANPPHIE